MTVIRRLCGVGAIAAFFSGAIPAIAAPNLEVRDAWVRATVPAQPVAGAYLTLKSRLPGRLISVRSPVARVVQIHQMSLDGGVMRMRRLPSLDLPGVTRFNWPQVGFT